MKNKFCELFGMGGVLVDTEAQYRAIWKHLGDKYGSETDYLENAVKEKNVHTILTKYFSHLTQNEKDSLVRELEEFESNMKYREIYGASRFVRELKDNGIKTGLVTNYNDKQLDHIFKNTEFKGLMDTVVSADDVEYTKPDSSGFIKAARNLGYEPEDCFVFEDSFTGIEAAKKAGMRVIALSTTNNKEALQNISTKVIPDYSNFTLADLNRMYGTGNPDTPVKEKKSNTWIILLFLLLALLALFLLWRSCNDRRDAGTDYAINDNSVELYKDSIGAAATDLAVETIERIPTNIDLPDGTRLDAYSNGIEERMVRYLNSDDYSNANEDNLKKNWYDFDNIQFEHASSSELQEGSFSQLNNVVQVLKNYPDTKIKIGGYADKTGTEEENQKISEARANAVKNYLISKGIAANRVETEGYSDDFAKHSASESEQVRGEDRTVALRFVK